MYTDDSFHTKLADLRQRRLAILLDDSVAAERMILCGPAQDVNYEEINLAIALTANNLFVALSPERTAAFLLSPMARPSTSVGNAALSAAQDLNMCVSVEAREGITTGISVNDRMLTIRALGEAVPNPRKLIKPGHIFPVETREGGVLVKHALPEGALDLIKLSGFSDAALFSDVLNESGGFASFTEGRELAARYKIPIFTLGEIVQHRLANEKLVTRMAEAKLPTQLAGELRAYIYKSQIHRGEHLALVKGNIDADTPVLTRIQLEFTFADVFGGSRPPSRQYINASLERIGKEEYGVLIYLRRPFRGVLKEQVADWDSFSQEERSSMIREYGIGSQILLDLGVRKVALLTNSPRDYSGVKSFGIEVVSQIPLKAVN